MEHSNFTILRKRTQQNKLAFKTDLFSFFFILTMFSANISLFASNEFTDMNLFLSSTQETCSGSSDGSVSVLVTGGTPNYTYAWNTGATTDIVYNLTSGTYIVTVTDSQGDTAVDSIEVELSPEGLWIMISTTEDAGCGPNGIAHVSAMTGVPPYLYQWDDPAMQTTEDAFNLYPGIYTVTVTDSNGCTAVDSTLVAGEDGISLGDFVFQDFNQDGIQQPWEAGVADIYVELYSAGPDGILFTDDDVQEDWKITDNDGLYLFECVDPGYYYIKFTINTDVYNFSPPYQGNDDELDSNADPVTGNTEAFAITLGMSNDLLSYDAGVYHICDDFTYGGTIGQNQIICPGDEPETLHTIIPPSGGSGTPEYLWLKSTVGGAFPGPSWMPIPDSNTENYDPGPLFTTMYYIRCIRREGCNSFLTESENQVVITVLEADDEYCQGANLDPFDPDITADIMADEEIMIKWTTGPENELYYYYVERSVDSINFEAISVLRGTANVDSNEYQFMDTAPINGRNVYRVKRLELISETAVYSNSVEIFYVGGDQSFMVYPNPVSDVLKVETSQSKAINTTLRMYNAMGQLLDVVELAAGETSAEINMKDFPSGVYFIHIPGNSDYKFEILKVFKK
jgi:SdrD B-like domain/Secretion system C-terminal sorting domain/SprB repeat